MNVFARFVGVLTSPKATFQNLVAHPRVLGTLILICVLSAAALGWFFSTPTGRDAWLNAALERGGAQMNDQQIAAIEKMAPFMAVGMVAYSVVVIPLLLLLVSGLLYAVFNAVMGGTATFKQILSVVVHAWIVPSLSMLFTLPLAYAKGTMTSSTNLAVLLPMVDPESVFGKFIGTVDFFMIWGVVVLAIGLGVLYRRKTSSIATGLFVLYGAISLLIATVF